MKKFLISLFLVSLLVAPLLIYAQEISTAGLPCKLDHTRDELGRYRSECGTSKTEDVVKNTASCCLIDKILTVGDYLFIGLLIIGVIVIIIAGWTFVTASDDPEKIKKARKTLIYGLIGIAIGFLAKVLVKVVAEIIT